MRLTHIVDAVSATAFTGFQQIVTRGLCEKICLDQHLSEHVPASSCPPHPTSQVCSKRTHYVHRSAAAGLCWSLLLGLSPA